MSASFQAVLFDLDGTLLDTLQDLADSMNAALAKLGFPAHPTDAYRYFVGDGMDALVERALPAAARSAPTRAQLKQLMQAEYERRWNATSRPYPGIAGLLDALQQRRLPMAVLSNKPEPFTRRAVAALLSPWRFALVRGARPDVPRKPDPTAALDIAAALGLEPARILYVGDTRTDMLTAAAAGMYALGATWGFRAADELLASGAQKLLETPAALLELL